MISFTMQSPEYFLIKLCQIALVWSLVVSRARASYKTVCYYESWAVYRRVDAKLGNFDHHTFCLLFKLFFRCPISLLLGL